MSTSRTMGSKNFYGLCLLFLFYSCTTASKKPIPKVYTVEIKQMQFQPAALAVQKGDTVVFVNRDLVAHNVTEVSNKEWSSGDLLTDKSWKMKVAKSADYYCTIHLVMKGKLVVQ